MSETDNASDGLKIQLGLSATCERVVPFEWTLANFNPKWPAVFSTPSMIALMEMATSLAIQPALAPGALTVGTRIEVDHIKAVPAGTSVIAKATLVEINGRRLIFDVEAVTRNVLIGRGRIFRAIIDQSRFMDIAASKPSLS